MNKIGLLLKALKETGLDDNTIIVFSGAMATCWGKEISGKKCHFLKALLEVTTDSPMRQNVFR